MAGSNGTMIVDEDRLFNGGPERFEWKMLGKREIFIPANAYKINSAAATYDKLLTPNHPNPYFQRYELRRVWVLEATLKEGYRHVYGKRVMFIDEDTWYCVLADHYDTRGQLWKYASTAYYYHPDMSAWAVRRGLLPRPEHRAVPRLCAHQRVAQGADPQRRQVHAQHVHARRFACRRPLSGELNDNRRLGAGFFYGWRVRCRAC
ncbi:hypothetical protein SSTU70S_00332 [Stutzerimonas stutzeri]